MGKTTDGTDKKQIWVMTINREYNKVTFWDVKKHQNWDLVGRIKKTEVKFLKEYLSTNLKEEERQKIAQYKA